VYFLFLVNKFVKVTIHTSCHLFPLVAAQQ